MLPERVRAAETVKENWGGDSGFGRGDSGNVGEGAMKLLGCQTIPIKRLLQGRVTDGPHETPIFTDEGIPFLSVDGIQDGKLKFEGCRFISQKDADIYRKKCAPTYRDVLLGKAASVGKVAYIDVKFTFSVWSPLALLKPKAGKLNGKFLYYCLQSKSVQRDILLLSNFNTQHNIGMRDIENLCIPNLSIEIQNEIANFLDRKTAAIDTLIAKKQRLIELLEEKRAALINQAVTKGLNPDVPMKDSGIPWIGEIPEHWEITKLKWLSPFITVGIVITPSKYYVDEGVSCLRSLNIKPGEILSKNLVYISEESNNLLAKSKIFKGDLVCVRTGQPGTTAVVDERFENANCIDLILIRKTKKASSEFLCLQMNSEICHSQYTVGTSGAIQQHFNVETAQNLILCDPPLDEQSEIVSHCQKIIEKHNLLMQKAFAQIEKLQEYRQSLITAAVTGKLEVPADEAAY